MQRSFLERRLVWKRNTSCTSHSRRKEVTSCNRSCFFNRIRQKGRADVLWKIGRVPPNSKKRDGVVRSLEDNTFEETVRNALRFQTPVSRQPYVSLCSFFFFSFSKESESLCGQLLFYPPKPKLILLSFFMTHKPIGFGSVTELYTI